MAKTILEYSNGERKEFDSPLAAFAYEETVMRLCNKGIFSEKKILECSKKLEDYLRNSETALNYDAISNIINRQL